MYTIHTPCLKTEPLCHLPFLWHYVNQFSQFLGSTIILPPTTWTFPASFQTLSTVFSYVSRAVFIWDCGFPYIFLQEWRCDRSRSSKVIDFGTNRKRVCDFLLVRHSNLSRILHRFRDIAGFTVLLTPTLIPPNFGGVLVGSDRPCWASTSAWALSYSAVKLFSKNSNLCDHGTWTLQKDEQTDRQTDRRYTMASPRSA